MKLLDRLNHNFKRVLGSNKMIQRDQLFVSYCHKDKIWLDRLNPYLSTIENFNGIKTWSDRSIIPGEMWYEEIAKALDSSRIAIFLVSQNFLASEFIMEKEMPYFLELNKSQRTPIFWVAISSCLFDSTPLKFIQCANDPNMPLDILSEAEQNKEITKICKKLQTLLEDKHSKDDKTPPTEMTRRAETKHIYSAGTKAVSAHKINIEITIDADFDSYSETEQKALLDAIKSMLSINGDIKIINKKRGSVLLTIELDHKDAEKIYAAINEGKFKHLKAISAKVMPSASSESESSKKTSNDYPGFKKANEDIRFSDDHVIEDVDSPFSNLHKIMDQLPPRHYRLLQLYYFDKLSIKQIAQKMELTPDAVKSSLARARKVLANILKESGSNLKESDIEFWDSDTNSDSSDRHS